MFYTAPTAIRAFMKWGDEHPQKHDLSSLRVLGTVGEPINPEAWMWYHKVIGDEKCPIVDTWWQTETGGHHDHPAARRDHHRARLGDAAVLRHRCRHRGQATATRLPDDTGGFLVIRKPWPCMLRGIYGDRDRFVETYWSEVEGVYFAGDGGHAG